MLPSTAGWAVRPVMPGSMAETMRCASRLLRPCSAPVSCCLRRRRGYGTPSPRAAAATSRSCRTTLGASTPAPSGTITTPPLAWTAMGGITSRLGKTSNLRAPLVTRSRPVASAMATLPSWPSTTSAATRCRRMRRAFTARNRHSARPGPRCAQAAIRRTTSSQPVTRNRRSSRRTARLLAPSATPAHPGNSLWPSRTGRGREKRLRSYTGSPWPTSWPLEEQLSACRHTWSSTCGVGC